MYSATTAFGAVWSSIDLGVRCISRSSLHWHYNVPYDGLGLPYLAPTHGGQDLNLDQHRPNPGQAVIFTVQVRNYGDQAVSGIEYRWLIDGQPNGSVQTYWETVSPAHPADANGEGVLDLNDLQIVLLQFSMGT